MGDKFFQIKNEESGLNIFAAIQGVFYRRGIAILCPGTITGSSAAQPNNSFVRIARLLERCEICSVRFDYVCRGNSEGNPEDFTIQSAFSDLRSVVDFMKSEYDGNNLGIYGKGGGAYLAGKYAFENKGVNTAVLFDPIISAKPFAEEPKYLQYFEIDQGDEREFNEMVISGRYFLSFIREKGLDAIAREHPNSGCKFTVIISNDDSEDREPLTTQFIKTLSMYHKGADLVYLDNYYQSKELFYNYGTVKSRVMGLKEITDQAFKALKNGLLK